MDHAKSTKKKRWVYECLWNKWKDYLWTTAEEKEIYDKGVILAIYLNKEHDELLTPLMVLLNNVLDYKEKQRIIEEYGLNTKKIESEVKDMCDLGESIALEARNEGKQIERKEKNIAHVKKLMIGLQISFKEAINLLEIPEKEVKEIEKYFQS